MKILGSGLTRKMYAVPILVFLIVKHNTKKIYHVRLFGSKHFRFYGISGNTIAVPDLLSLILSISLILKSVKHAIGDVRTDDCNCKFC